MKRTIGTLMVAGNNAGPSYACSDSNAVAFFVATGITDSTIQSAICTLIASAKSNGWWAKCNVIYPFVGGTANTCKYNLKDPQDTNAAFRMTWNGTPTFASTGVSGWSSSDYGDTNFVSSSVLSIADNHISVYSRTNNNTGGDDFLSYNNVSAQVDFGLSLRIGFLGINSPTRYYHSTNLSIQANDSDSRALYLGVASGSGVDLYKNGVSFASSGTIQSTLSSNNVNIGNAGAFGPTTREYAFATIGSGIDATLQATMYTDIQTFQTALSRQV